MATAETNEPLRICFVCLGNICRSPTAEGVMARLVRDAGLGEQILIDSAGTGAWHTGEPADRRSATEARRRGIELTSRARQFHPGDFYLFDLVVAMDRRNLADLRDLAPEAHLRDKITLLRSYVPGAAQPARSSPDSRGRTILRGAAQPARSSPDSRGRTIEPTTGAPDLDPDEDRRADLDVPDPYFGEGDGFARVFDIIDAACTGLLDHVRATHL